MHTLKFIHLTDTHLVAPGELLKDLNPALRLASCIDSLNRDHTDAEFCILTGDLADRGEDKAYEFLIEVIQQCAIKFHLIVGNHDDRQKCLHWFPDTPVDEDGFIQYSFKTKAGIFIMLDTIQTGSHGGVYCDKRRGWLAKTLETHQQEPVFLFMHHPPFDLHLPCIDRIGLEDQQEFAEVVRPFKNIRHLFFGHAHRPVNGNWNGISFSSLRGTNHQIELDFHTADIIYSNEPPEYCVVFVSDNQIVVHTHSYPLI